MVLRFVSAFILAPLALAAAWYGGWPFAVFWGIAAVAVMWEWVLLVAGPGHRLMFSSGAGALVVAGVLAWLSRPLAAIAVVCLSALGVVAFAPTARRLWVAGGLLYAGVMLLAPMILRSNSGYGFLAMVFVFAVVWATDILGYFGGRTFGGPKLAPAISPQKTWSGAISGAVGAMLAGLAIAVWLGFGDLAALALLALALSIVAQGGDLMESRIKRYFNVKDASQLVPGHGGVMDRLDGFWAAALVGCLIGLARGGFGDAARGLLVW